MDGSNSGDTIIKKSGRYGKNIIGISIVHKRVNINAAYEE
jgi:hypothetical protein